MHGLPREHGGTVMTAAALLGGWAAAAESRLALAGMVPALVGLFLAREPAGLLLRPGPAPRADTRRDYLRLLFVGGVLAAGGGIVCLATLPLSDLALLAAVGVPLFALAVVTRARRLDRTLWAEVLGIGAIALPAPAAYLAAAGQLDTAALRLYSACLIFFLGATLHLRMLLRERKAVRKGEREPRDLHWLFSVASVAVAAVLFAVGWFNPLELAGMSLALLRPVLVRGWFVERPTRTGILESVLTVLFVVSQALGAAAR